MGVFRRAHRSPIQNGVVSKWTLQPTDQPTHQPTNHCLGGLTGPSWFSTFTSPHRMDFPPSLHEGHCLGLVNELLGGPRKHGASMEATLLQMATPCVPEDLVRKAFCGGASGSRTTGIVGSLTRSYPGGLMLKLEGGITVNTPCF